MRNTVFSYLLIPLLAVFSLSATAAPATAVSEPVSNVSPVMAQSSAGKIDLNKADELTLQSELVGIGQAKARSIVAYREANGPFSNVDELLEIKGIGAKLLERNRDRLMVE
nr:helix-hairpin-helix domain-containing protein [uncultured Pseudomonas sp.]